MRFELFELPQPYLFSGAVQTTIVVFRRPRAFQTQRDALAMLLRHAPTPRLLCAYEEHRVDFVAVICAALRHMQQLGAGCTDKHTVLVLDETTRFTNGMTRSAARALEASLDGCNSSSQAAAASRDSGASRSPGSSRSSGSSDSSHSSRASRVCATHAPAP